MVIDIGKLEHMTKSEIIEHVRVESEKIAAAATADAGIIVTSKGALMVRVGADRWPIAMYRRDWEILLKKVPLIQEALEKLDIPWENPSKDKGARAVTFTKEESTEALQAKAKVLEAELERRSA